MTTKVISLVISGRSLCPFSLPVGRSSFCSSCAGQVQHIPFII